MPFELASEMSRFANCSGFSEGQIATLAALRGGTSAVAAVVTIGLLVITCTYQSRLVKTDTKLKVHLFALFGVSISYLTVLSLGAVYHRLPEPTAGRWCAAFGFFDQILSVIQITLLFIVITEVFRSRGSEEKISGKMNWVLRISQGTVIVLAAMIVISSFVPFITGSYGEVGGWCWILSIDENCEVLVVGLMEQMFLWIIYRALISLICILIVLRAVVLFMRACKHSREVKGYDNLDDRHNFKHILCKYIFQLIIFVPMFLDLFELVPVTHVHHYSFTLWVLYATALPISGFLIPLSFLLYINFGDAGSGDNLSHAQNNPPARAHSRHSPHSTTDLRGGIKEITEQEDKHSTTWLSADNNPSWYVQLNRQPC